MKKICLFIILSLCFATVYAEFDLRTAISYIGKSNLPFDFTKEGDLYSSYRLYNPNNVIPDKIYENFQLTEYFNARDNIDTLTEYFNARDNIDTGLDLCFTCKLGSDLYLCLIRVGGIIEPATYVLTSVNSSYNVVQSLEVGVTLAGSYLKQFRITDNRQVYVYRLVPTSNASVSFRTFKSVEAYVTETVYTIDMAGQFILTSPEKRVSSTRTFSRDELEKMTQDLWELH